MAKPCNIEDRTDHLGQIFESQRKMCEFWEIDNATYRGRRRDGATKEEALTTPSGCFNLPIEDRTDHLGIIFDTQKEMCEFWNIEKSTYYGRISSGWTKEKALTTPTKGVKHGKEDRTDHLGTIFNSKKEMCEYWNIDIDTYRRRMNNGYTKEDALTIPSRNTKIFLEDPVSNKKTDRHDLENKYGVEHSLFVTRMSCTNNNLIRSLGISVIIDRRHNNINKKKYNLLISKRIKKGKDVFECYIDNGDGTSTFKIMSYDMIDQYCLDQYKIHNNII